MKNHQSIGLLIALLTLIGMFIVPEVRDFFGSGMKNGPKKETSDSNQIGNASPSATEDLPLMDPLSRPYSNEMSLSIEDFLEMKWSGNFGYKPFIGSDVVWEAEYAGRDDRSGIVMFAIYDGKVHVVIPSTDKNLLDMLNQLEQKARIGDLVRVSGTLQEVLIPDFNTGRGSPVIVASDFDLVQAE